ncbi:MAG: bacillithiol system redox-active protein YtxJ [Armatimonadota bacterium]
MITPCRDENEFDQLLSDSAELPIFVFKHSTRCPVSAHAHDEFSRFAEEHPEIDCRKVLVIEQRPLSQYIAQQTGVAHQSPQALLISGGKVAWSATHFSISADGLSKAYDEASGNQA